LVEPAKRNGVGMSLSLGRDPWSPHTGLRPTVRPERSKSQELLVEMAALSIHLTPLSIIFETSW